MVEQKTIEEQINNVLSGDSLKNALDFIDFMHANKLPIDYDGKGDGCAVGGIVGDSIGYMLVNGNEKIPGPWTIWFNSCDFDETSFISDELKEATWTHASKCGKCNKNWENCGGGARIIFGREFENLCHSPLMFTNPDSKTLENIKKLIFMLK